MKEDKRRKLNFDSKAVYYAPDEGSNSIGAPIFMSSSFHYGADVYQKVVDGERKSVNIYGRCGNPNEYQFEEQMIMIEGADACLATASGMAAISVTLFGLLKSGDHIVCDWTTYSSTHEMLDHRLTDYGISTTFVDTSDADAVKNAIQENTKVLYFESIANPSMKVPDFDALVKIAHEKEVVVVCDNTFASPYVQQPLNHGIDIVLHSATKYLGGHSDLIAGALVIGKKDDALVSRMANIVNSLGPITGAFDSYLILRSLKTLAVRMERHCENALAIAKHFESHKEISEVIYPGLSNHPQHDLASKQMKGYGGIISMNIKGGLEKSKSFLERTEIFALAESLGGVESLIEHPALMTHASLPKDRREMIGISDGLVRLSVGLESLDDLVEDIEQALK